MTPNTSASLHGPLIAASTKFFATPWKGGGGPVFVSRLDKLGKVEPNPHLLLGHKAPVLDLAFYPFDDTVLATGGDDALIKVGS
jgi:coronin-1B/1C/6